MRRTITAFLEPRSHQFRRRFPRLIPLAYWPGRESIRIDDLLSPLRYDILVRERYFALLREHRALAADDFGAFMELSRQHLYFDWFTRVVIAEYRSEMVGDDQLVDAAFERRVRGCIELHDTFQSAGYDKRRPIILRTGRQIAPTSTGKRLARRMYAGDGCHRLACLRAAGVEVLQPDMYRMHIAEVLTPRDDTALLLRLMAISPGEYFSFLSLSYADREFHSEEALLDHVGSIDPGRLQELQQVIAVDSQLLVAAS
jgi:hypothetical protein